MAIRWRLGTLAVQIAVLVLASRLLTGTSFSSATWYTSILALAINSELLEPFFARPVDVLGNCIVAFLLFALAPKSAATPGWNLLAIALVVAAVLSALALILGAKQAEGDLVPAARAARILSGAFSAKFIYSATFLLGLIDATGGISGSFWSFVTVWLVILAIASVNWETIWATARGQAVPASPEGLIGPSKLLVAAPSVPPCGTTVTIDGAGVTGTGAILARVRRSGDVWAAIHVNDAITCEALLTAKSLVINPAPGDCSSVLGIADVSSTNSTLVFSPTRPLRIGQVVAVDSPDGPVLYQVTKAEVVDLHVKGGGHLAIQARATQVGVLQVGPVRMTRYRWVPEPGAAVIEAPGYNAANVDPRFLLGNLIGTGIPVFLDGDLMCEGHLAILGMTRMGKTTLASRLANHLSANRAVIVMDQTGEYRAKLGFPVYVANQHLSTAGVSVFEPAAGRSIPEQGVAHLAAVANQGYTEYRTGNPFPRVLLVDEAHQFVPEPALLAFGPARDAAIKFGMQAMQVRKYAITITMISQRTAVLAKSALSQCENVIAFKSVDQTGLDYLEAILGAGAREILPNLQQGEALVSGPAISSDYPVAVKLAMPSALAANAQPPVHARVDAAEQNANA